MTYRVLVQTLALDDLDEYCLWVATHAPDTAARWLARFQDALQTLSQSPERCALAPENPRLTREVRQFLFGKRPNVYRAVFTIDGDTVRVLRIRRATRRFFTKRDLGE